MNLAPLRALVASNAGRRLPELDPWEAPDLRDAYNAETTAAGSGPLSPSEMADLAEMEFSLAGRGRICLLLSARLRVYRARLAETPEEPAR